MSANQSSYDLLLWYLLFFLLNSSHVGENSIIEEYCSIKDSNIGDRSLVEVYTVIEDSTIGNGCVIGPSCKILKSSIGHQCFIAPSVQLNGANIPDHTSVYLQDGKWVCDTANVEYLVRKCLAICSCSF